MSYKKILKKVAKEYNTTAKEVDREIHEAIKEAGLNITPAAFITLASAIAKHEICNQSTNGKA